MTATTYRDAATALWGEAGAYAHDAYNRWLPRFPELPDELPIVIGITAYGSASGYPRWLAARAAHHDRVEPLQGRPARRRRHDGPRDAHAWLYVTGQSAPAHKSDHDTEAWYAAIRRLSPAVLGHELDVRRGAARKSVRVKLDDGSSVVRKVAKPDYTGPTHEMVARWPHRFGQRTTTAASRSTAPPTSSGLAGPGRRPTPTQGGACSFAYGPLRPAIAPSVSPPWGMKQSAHSWVTS